MISLKLKNVDDYFEVNLFLLHSSHIPQLSLLLYSMTYIYIYYISIKKEFTLIKQHDTISFRENDSITCDVIMFLIISIYLLL